MPSRSRTVGPQASEDFAEIVRSHRVRQKLSMPKLAAIMSLNGDEMSPATINAVENGTSSGDARRTRLVTVDELKAFIRALNLPAQEILDWLYDQEGK